MPAPYLQRALTLLAAILSLATALDRPLGAQTNAYTGGATATAPATGSWNASGNWSAGLPASGTSTVLTFGGSGTSYTATNDLGSPFTLNGLTFSATGGSVTIAGSPLAFDGTSALISQGGAAAVTLSTAVSFLADTEVFASATSGGLTLTGVLSGAGTLTKTGDGTLEISGAGSNTLSELVVSGGTVNLAKSGGAIAVDGLLQVDTGATVTLGAAQQVSTESALVIDGTLNLNGYNLEADGLVFSAGQVQLGSGTLTLNTSSIAQFGGVISGTGSVVKTGAGWQMLLEASTYSGGTFINGGELIVENETGSATGTGAVTIGAAGTLSGSGFIVPEGGNGITVNGTLAPGGTLSDVLTFGSATEATTLTFTNGSLLLLDICGCAENTALYVFGELEILTGATLQIDLASAAMLSGSYTLASFTSLDGAFGDVIFDGASVGDGTSPFSFGGTHHLVYGSGSLTLVPSAIPEPSTYAAWAGIAALFVAWWRRRRRSVR